MEPPTVSVTLDIAAAPARVWELVTDIALMPVFSDELQSVQWLDDITTPRLGARFEGVNSHPQLGTWTTRSHIVEYTPPTVFAWAVGEPNRPAATWLFELDTAAHAATRLRHTAQIGPGPSGITTLLQRHPDDRAQIIADRLRQLKGSLRSTLTGIKALAEQTQN